MAREQRLNVEEIDPNGRSTRRPLPVRLARWIVRHPLLTLFALAILATVGTGLHWWFLPNHPTLDAAEAESITVRLGKYDPNIGHGPGYEQTRIEVTIDEPSKIQTLLDAFRAAKRGKEHNCGNSGVILVRRKDGIVEEVYVLPGHDERYYEYRLDTRISRIDRGPFLAALKALGLEGVKTVPPS